MPMLDAYIPEGALPAEAEKALLVTLTNVLLEHEGVDPSESQQLEHWPKVWLHRPAAVLHAGEEPAVPHYRVIPSVPEGQFDDERRVSMVAAVTEAILDAEGMGVTDRDPSRIWVFANEIPDGTWGGGGRIAVGLPTSPGWPLATACPPQAAHLPSGGWPGAGQCPPESPVTGHSVDGGRHPFQSGAASLDWILYPIAPERIPHRLLR